MSPEALRALQAWFAEAKLGSKRLPRRGANLVLDSLQDRFGLNRNQISYAWRKYKTDHRLVQKVHLGMTPARVREVVAERTGAPGELLEEMITQLECSSLIENFPEFRIALHCCKADGLFGSVWTDRLKEYITFYADNFPNTSRTLNACALRFVCARSESVEGLMHVMVLLLQQHAVSQYLDPVPGTGAVAGPPLISDENLDEDLEVIDNARRFTRYVDDKLFKLWCDRIRDFDVEEIVISPDVNPAADVDPVTFPIVYYISGWVLCAIRKFSDRRRCRVLTAFHASNMIAGDETKGLPDELVRLRTRGGLVFASRMFYSLMLVIEGAYTRYCTLASLAIHGAGLVQKVHTALQRSARARYLFQACASRAKVAADVDVDVDSILDDLFAFLLKAFLRMRGKDFVRSAASSLKKKVASKTLSTRQSVAAATVAAASRDLARQDAVVKAALAGSEEKEVVSIKSPVAETDGAFRELEDACTDLAFGGSPMLGGAVNTTIEDDAGGAIPFDPDSCGGS
jgi:hypothetical protein